MRDDANAQDTLFMLQDTIQKLEHFKLTRYANTAACALVVYDLMLTMDDTIRYVWSTKFSLPKGLYYITRYATAPLLLVATHRIPLPLDDKFCKILGWIAGGGQILLNGSSLFLMSLRVRALWRSHPRFNNFIRIFYTLGWMSTLVFVLLSLLTIQKNTIYYPLADTCYSESKNPHMFLVTLIPLGLELVFTTLTTIKAYQNVRNIKNASLPPLMSIFIRDGILYFTTISILSLGNALVWILLPSTLIYVGLYIYFACITTFICRFYINLLKAASAFNGIEHRHSESTSAAISTHTQYIQRRSKRERWILGDGEFELSESMMERHGFWLDVDVDEDSTEFWEDKERRTGTDPSTPTVATSRGNWEWDQERHAPIT